MRAGLHIFGYLMAIAGFGLLMTAFEARNIEKSPYYRGERASSETLYVYGGVGAVLAVGGMYTIFRTEIKEG